MPSTLSHRVRRTVWNGLRLRCPRCGKEPLFRGLFAMGVECRACGLRYEREAGYFVGAIYINYAATVVLSLAGYFLLDAYSELTPHQEIAVWGAFAAAFPVWFFRYSRSLWLTLDHVFNPEPPDLRLVRPTSTRSRS
jgi:uncharacterized protein (DUF983 family)